MRKVILNKMGGSRHLVFKFKKHRAFVSVHLLLSIILDTRSKNLSEGILVKPVCFFRTSDVSLSLSLVEDLRFIVTANNFSMLIT